jgi:hypothetical protein
MIANSTGNPTVDLMEAQRNIQTLLGGTQPEGITVKRLSLPHSRGRVPVMRARALFLLPFFCAGMALFQKGPAPVHAQTQASVALEGQVTSAEEGPMEGVLVSARKAGSTITIPVVSDPLRTLLAGDE